MIVRIGDVGPHVIKIQVALDKAGCWPLDYYSDRFGPATDKAVRKFQKDNNLVIDGRVGQNTLELLGVNISKATEFDETYKGVIINGSVFPDKKVQNVTVNLNSEMINEYLPIIEKMDISKGMKMLCTIMAYKEGFRKGTRSYKTNNPGNIGNVDSGKNNKIETLEDGIQLQVDFILSICENKRKAFPINKRVILKPYFSPEIAKHTKLYGMSPYLPGYEFVFTGQLDQFVKIYATGARAGNGYLSMITSYFKNQGYDINAQSKIQDIIQFS